MQIHTRDTALKVKEHSHTLNFPVNSALLIAKYGLELFDKCYNWSLPLRSVGIRAINLKGEGAAVQEDLFGEADREQRIERIENSISSVRDRFGKDSIKRGRILDRNK